MLHSSILRDLWLQTSVLLLFPAAPHHEVDRPSAGKWLRGVHRSRSLYVLDRCELEQTEPAAGACQQLGYHFPIFWLVFTHSAKAETPTESGQNHKLWTSSSSPSSAWPIYFTLSWLAGLYPEYPPIPRSYVSSVSAALLLLVWDSSLMLHLEHL